MKKETRSIITTILLCNKKKKSEPPPGVEEVICKRGGRIISCDKNGNKYKVKVRYPFGRIIFEEFIVTPDSGFLELKKSKSFASRLAKKRSVKIKNKSKK